MPLFEVKTRSTFENVYHIEADTVEDAKLAVINECISDFYQKHLGEGVISADIAADESAATCALREQGYM